MGAQPRAERRIVGQMPLLGLEVEGPAFVDPAVGHEIDHGGKRVAQLHGQAVTGPILRLKRRRMPRHAGCVHQRATADPELYRRHDLEIRQQGIQALVVG
ncbi:hypothetical protein CO669_21935 [Bradyrhizobium sp. Y36]|nr:hypothetical protein CO669_21935 [Bradyrhizobium sp. Y36]